MARPTKHPKSGTYRVRLMIPAGLRDAAYRLFGVKTELVESLGTKDAREAARLGPPALVRLNARLDEIAQAHAGAGRDLTDMDAVAMGGEAYRFRMAAQGGNVGKPEDWRVVLDHLGDQRDTVNDHGDFEVTPNKADRAEAAEMLREGGWEADAARIEKVAAEVTVARGLFAQTMLKRSHRDWSPDAYVATFPVATPRRQQAPPVVSFDFDALITGWAKDHGHSLNVKPISRAAYDRRRTLMRLGEFLRHTDAAAVVKSDVVRWKEDMQCRDLAVATIRNDISEMSAIWRWAIRQGTLTVNPFEGVAPPKEKRHKKTRRAFTQAEAKIILTAARSQPGYIRWLPWVCCFTGARISEICQANKADLVVIEGVHVLRIHDEGDAEGDDYRSLKNDDSRRNVPLHPALIAEGFLDYIERLPAGSAMFPDAKPDRIFGNRSINAGKKLSRWLRADLTITDRRISPNHSWRHWFIEVCRGTQMHPEVRSALTGHSAKLDESSQYGAGMGSFVRVLYDALALVPSPLAAQADQPGDQ